MLVIIETIRIWSKLKLSEFFQAVDFKYRAKVKTRKSRKWAFLLIKPRCKVKIFCHRSFFSVFRFWVSQTTKSWSKRKLSEISKFSNLGIGQNRELGKHENWHFSLLNHMVKLWFSFYYWLQLFNMLNMNMQM